MIKPVAVRIAHPADIVTEVLRGRVAVRTAHPTVVNVLRGGSVLGLVRTAHPTVAVNRFGLRRVRRAHRMPETGQTHRLTRQSGFTLVEMLIAISLAAILMAGLNGVIGQALSIQDAVSERNDLTQQARFAMEQMVRAVSHSQKLLLPSPENINTSWPESVREFPPRVAFPNETAVLAFLLDANQDLDADGFADADNDKDGVIDEDPGGDSNFDLAPGLFAIDDDNDGSVDEQHLLIWPGGNLGPTNEDDDEDNYANEDLIDGLDNDGDGKLDEDIKKQTDGDNLSGIGGVDDDGDGNIDEGDKNDDDEDGSVDEDWYDTVVFYLNAVNNSS